jgi:hypothetical protein
MSREQVRDLVAYLASPVQVPLASDAHASGTGKTLSEDER